MKKGFIFDILFGMILLVVIAFFIIIGAWANSLVMGAFANSTVNASTTTIQTAMTSTFNTFNYGFLFAVVGMFLTVGILAYYINLHPMFYPFLFIIMVIIIFVSFYLANAYWSFVTANASFQAVANQFWVVTWIMKNLPFTMMIYCFFIALMTWIGKKGGE
jgi:hypothetical protein